MLTSGHAQRANAELGNGRGQQKTAEQRLSGPQAPQLFNEEDDYEDMMTPTDDEGIASLNHTQKIPISLIKAKDKASVSTCGATRLIFNRAFNLE